MPQDSALLRETVRRIISSAEGLSHRCAEFMTSLRKQVSPCDARGFVKEHYYRLFCGQFESAREGPLTLLCTLLDAFVREQYSGFSTYSDDVRALLDEGFAHGGLSCIDTEGWEALELNGRRYVAWALWRLNRRLNKPSEGKPEGAAGPPNDIDDHLVRDDCLDPKDEWVSARMLSVIELSMLRQRALQDDDETPALPKTDQCLREVVSPYSLRQFLLRELEASLARSSADTPSLRVSLLLKLLGGRYLDMAGHPDGEFEADGALHPSAVFGALRLGVDFVLEAERQGTWAGWADENLLYHHCAPLLHILDLRTEVLMASAADLERLAESTSRTLDSLSLRFEREETQLKYKQGYSATMLSHTSKCLFETLATATMVLDRFKDLLSDSILEELGVV